MYFPTVLSLVLVLFEVNVSAIFLIEVIFPMLSIRKVNHNDTLFYFAKIQLFCFCETEKPYFLHCTSKDCTDAKFASLQDYSFLNDFTGLTVAARKLRKVTTATVTPKTATNAKANTQTCSGT